MDAKIVWFKEVFAFHMEPSARHAVILDVPNMSRRQVCAVLMDLLESFVNPKGVQKLQFKVVDVSNMAPLRCQCSPCLAPKGSSYASMIANHR